MAHLLTKAGNMMPQPLRVIDLLAHASERFAERRVISRTRDLGLHESNYRTIFERCGQLAHGLEALGVDAGECVATLAWNTHRHMELYYAVSGIGAVLHTVNPRLFSDQIEYIIDHADDRYVFVDPDFLPIIAPMLERLHKVKGVIVLCDDADLPDCDIPITSYEALLRGHPTQYAWPTFDENQAAMLCYTSGTTGEPKGVLYSQRSIVMHAQATVSPSLLDLREDSVLLPMVTMYHVGAWGAPYAAPLVGCTLVLPGHDMSGAGMWELIERYQVDVALGVPTIWLTLHNYLQEHGIRKLPLARVCVGGAASPLGLVKSYWQHYGIYWQPIWGMTETGPLVTSAPPSADIMALDDEQRFALQTTAGRAVFGVEMGLFDGNDEPVAHDGVSQGELRVRGPWICRQYYKRDDPASFPNGWLATGDIAVIDAQGFMKVVDRKKDVIKSGGEWISSLDIENIVSQHPKVNESCVIGVRHPKWDERPLLLVHPVSTLDLSQAADVEQFKQTLYQFMQGKIAKWWTPDDIIVVTELPHTGTGKLTKNVLRDRYMNHLMEQANEPC